jgi:hypothetical protein
MHQPLAETYKSFSNLELLQIIDNPEDYQPFALEAAKKELENRNLAEEVMAGEVARLEQGKMLQLKQQEQRKVRKQKVHNITQTVSDIFDPLQTNLPTHRKTIISISILIGGLAIYNLFRDYRMIGMTLDFNVVTWATMAALYTLPVIASILFLKVKKWGWILMCVYLTYQVFELAYSFINYAARSDDYADVYARFFPNETPYTYMAQGIFFISLLVIICMARIRVPFNISNYTAYKTSGLALVGAFLLITLL